MPFLNRTHHAPSPAAPAATTVSASSARASSSAGTSAGRKKSAASAMLSYLNPTRLGRKKERNRNPETPPPVSAARTPQLVRSNSLREGRNEVPQVGPREAGEAQPELRRADSPASPAGSQRSVEHEATPASADLESVQTPPDSPRSVHLEHLPDSPRPEDLDTPDGSPRTSTQDELPHFDASSDATQADAANDAEGEIVEEPKIESHHDTRSEAGSINSGGASPQSDPSSISGEVGPLPTGRNDPANLLRDAHKERHSNPYHASTDTVLFGIRTTSRPSRPMTLPHAGPAPTPMEHATPAESGTVDPPPSARAETGMKKRKKLAAVRAFVDLALPPFLRRSKPDEATRGRTNVEAFAPELTKRADFDSHIQSLFKHSAEDTAANAGENADSAELALQLRLELQSSERDSPINGAGPELGFTHPTILAERLAQVTGGDPGRALEAFAALRQGSFLTFSSVDRGDGSSPEPLESLLTLPPGRASLAEPQLDALRTAAKLASSPTGFEALLRTLQPALPENRQPHLKRFLEAVAKVEAERGAPGDIAVHTSTARGALDTNQSSLAQEVLHIESRALEHVGDDPHASLNAREKAAIFSWDNGFRDRGPGTELAKVQGRLAKMSKYVQRANHLQELRNVKFQRNDMVRSAVKVVDAKARILAMRAQQTVGRKKTPLTGLRKFGANNNFLMHPDDDVAVLDDNAKTAIKTLLAHDKQHSPADETFAPDLQNPRLTSLPEPVLRQALLEHWESLLEEKQLRPLGNRLDDAALKTIAQKIATRYQVDTEQTRELIEGRLQRWAGSKLKRHGWKLERVVDRELTLADLQKWAGDTHLKMTERTPLGQAVSDGVSAAPTQLQETDFGAALRKALAVVDSSAVRPDDLTPDGLHRFTRTYLLEHNWGNPLVASNGGTAGINTAGISESIRRVTEKFSPVSVVPILDLRLSRSSNAVLSIGSTTHGGEIFVGTQRQKTGSAGIGLTASGGPGVLAKVLGQGTASAEITPLAIENVRTRGVMVRALRPPKADRTGFDTDAARAELVEVNDLIWSLAKGEHGALSPEQTWELIANRFFKSQTLSIGWQDQEAQTVHHPVSASAGLRIGHSIGKIAGLFAKSETERAGLSVGYAGDLTTHGANRRKEATGKHRLLRSAYLWRFQQNMTLGAALTNPSIPLSHAAGPVTASMVSGPTQITRTFALDDRGFNSTFRAIVKSGKLSEPFTLREFEERNAKDFVKFLNEPARHAQFTQVFKATYGLEKGAQAFENFKKKAQNWAGPGQHYVTRYRIRAEDRKILDELAAVAHSIHERDPEDPMLNRIGQAMKARLEDEDSWIPSQTFTLEGQTARDALSVNLGVQFSAQETVASDRELSAVVVPLPIANEWTRARRNMRMGDPSVRQGSEERTAGA